MMNSMKARLLIVTAAAAAITMSAFGALSPENTAWGRGPVQWLMTAQEQAAWKAIDNDAAAADFIELFWARRDPTPGTPKNEYKDDFDLRVASADKNFTSSRTRGSMGDRGKVLILFGSPSKVQRSSETPTNNIQTPNSIRGNRTEAVDSSTWPTQIWIWDADKAQKVWGVPHVELRFVDRMNQGEYRMETPLVDFKAAQQKAIAAMILNPDLKVPPSKQPVAAAPVASATPVAASAAPAEGIKTAALQEAINAAKGAKSKGIVGYTEFVSPLGDYFVPVALAVPKSAGISKDSVDTLFGEIVDATGAKVASFEEPAKIVASMGDFFADKTVNLGAGKYTATLGLAKAGVPVVVSTGSLDLTPVAKDAVGTSRLILWNDVQTLNEAAPPKAPYAWGKLQLVPKFDLTFSNKDDLGYFVEVNNPGIDATTNQPKLQMGIDLLVNGKVRSQMPLMEVEAVSLSGVPGPGHWAVVNSIPLSKMSHPLEPGDYTMKMKILDVITKQSYTVQQTFKITG